MHVFNQLEFIRDKIKHVPGINEKPSGGIELFGRLARYTVDVILKEKEIIFFAFLQWLTIALVYLLWVQMFDWIPDEVWEAASNSDDGVSAADIILITWSFFCVGLASYPIGIFTGCIGAAHFFNKQGRNSSIISCLAVVIPQSWPLWMFHWIDGWFTCRRIFARLPKRDGESAAKRAREEALYYAWKLGVAGVLPSILTGDDLIQSGKNSVIFVRRNFMNVSKFRAGYSALCWIIGILGYIAGVFFLILVVKTGGAKTSSLVYEYYSWAVIPLMISLAPVMLILRPIYVISLCDLYSDFLDERGTPAVLSMASSKGIKSLMAFIFVAVTMMIVFIFRDELGLIRAFENSYK